MPTNRREKSDETAESMVCAYCFGRIVGKPHVVRGRPYHPPVMTGRRPVPGSGCAAKDAAPEPKPAKVDPEQLKIDSEPWSRYVDGKLVAGRRI